MVKNVEFVPQKEMMITSAFDGNINMWDINWSALTVTTVVVVMDHFRNCVV